MVRVFAHLADHALARGLRRGYVARPEDLVALRGRVDLAVQIRRGGLPVPLACRFDEHTEDLPLNRHLRAARSLCLRLPWIPVPERRLLLRLAARFDDVSAKPP